MLTRELRSEISRELDEEFTVDDGMGSVSYPWLIDFDPVAQFAIAECKIGENYGTWRIPYVQDDDGDVTFGTPQEIEQRYVLKGTNVLVASAVLEGDSAEAVLAEIISGNPAYAGLAGGPNGHAFVCDLTILDTRSQHAGATKFQLRADGAEKAMATLAGKPVHVTSSLTGHFEAGQPFRPVGVMLGGKVCKNDAGAQVVRAAGVLWDRDFPAVVNQIKAAKSLLGASWEIEYPREAATRIDGQTVELANWTYSGAAILLKNAAAYPDTALLHANRVSATEITTKQRNDLPDSDFAVVTKTDSGAKVRKLPIHDEQHRSNAWSRVNQKGTDLTDAQRSAAKDRIMNRAKSAGDTWAKGYSKKGGDWVKTSSMGKGKGSAMAGKFASYNLPDGTDESVIERIVNDALAQLQAGKELAALKDEAASLQAAHDRLTTELAAMTTKSCDMEQAKTKAEADLAAAATELEASKAKIGEYEAAAAAAQLKVKAQEWWAAHAKKNGLAHLAQAEVDKRWPLIEKAAKDEGLTMAEWTQLNAGQRSGSQAPGQRARVEVEEEVPLMAGADDSGMAYDAKALRKMLPALSRALDGKPAIR